MPQCGWTMAKLWGALWAGQRVLCLLQGPFKRSMTLTLTRGNC